MATAKGTPSSPGRSVAGTRLLTAVEVADMLQLAPKTVRRWARAKRTAHLRSATNRLRSRSEHIEEFIEQHQVAAVGDD